MELTQLLPPLAGGAIIGLAGAILLLFNGRIAGISGIVAGILRPVRFDLGWRLAFTAGLLVGGLLFAVVRPSVFPPEPIRSLPVLAFAGLLVGLGARLGSGCTSGHGVCGIGRLSPRGLVATCTFLATGALTVLVVRDFFGGAL